MALKSGLASTLGFKKETTPGVAVTPTNFQPFASESLTYKRDPLEGEGIIAGRRTVDSSQWNGGNNTIGGDTGLEMYDRGIGPLLEAIFGGVATIGSGPYTHTFTPGDLATYTVQVGRPSVLGVVHPFTHAGAKVASAEIAFAQGAVGTMGITWAAMSRQAGSRTVADGVTTSSDATVTSATAAFTQADVGKTVTATGVPVGTRILSVTNATTIELTANATATATGVSMVFGLALATPSYAADRHILKFNHASVTIDGEAVPVTQATISIDNGLKIDRRFLGSGDIAEPLEEALRVYTGSVDIEFTNQEQEQRYLNGEEFPLVLSVAVPGTPYSLTFTLNIRYESADSNVGGKEIVMQALPFKAVGAGTDASAITAVFVSLDATI